MDVLAANAASKRKPAKGGAKTAPAAPLSGASTIRYQRRARFNPIRQLDPEQLARILDDFDSGALREGAMLMETITERDDLLKGVKSKRELSIAQLPWEVIALDESPEALRHKAALEFFWNHITATSVYDRNIRGGFSRLVRQMMEAVSYRYSTHHIVLQPLDEVIEFDGGTLPALTATFEHVPLYFFENREGILRYLAQGFGIQGADLEPTEWLTTVGDGLMVACAICYTFKRMALQDWVMFCEKFGIPGVHAETSAAYGSDEWKAVVEAAARFMNDWGCVTSAGTKFNLLQASGGASALPMQPLAERMDRAMSALYRGADLSTMSAGSGAGDGASLQGKESELLEQADAAMITESLNQVDRLVLQWHFGSTRGLAYTKIISEPQQDTKLQIEIDKFLLDSGAPLAVTDVLERYGRTRPEDDEELLTKPQPPAPPAFGATAGEPPAFGNARLVEERALKQLLAASRRDIAQALSADMRIVQNVVRKLLGGPDAQFPQRLAALRAALPSLRRRVLSGELKTEAAFEQVLAPAMANGLTQPRT